MWMVLVAVLASGGEPLSAPPLVNAEESAAPATSNLSPDEERAANVKATAHRVEQSHVPMLSQSAAKRTLRLFVTASGAGVGAVVGGIGFAAVGFIAGGIVGGCGIFSGGSGCWNGLVVGALAGHATGLILGTHLIGHVLGTNTPFWISVLGGLAAEAAMLLALPMSGESTMQFAALLSAPLVSALVHEIADTSGSSSKLAIAPMPLRGGGGLAALISF